MTRKVTTIVALAIGALVASNASAQTNDHFARQRQESLARVAAAQQHLNYGHHPGGHWGGPTTTTRYYNPTSRFGIQQNIQFYPVNPYGYGYGIPNYGYYGVGNPYYYGNPYCAPGGTGVYIHREIYLGR